LIILLTNINTLDQGRKNNMPKKCRICGKSLSTYNKEDICFCHQEGMVIKEKSPVSGCTSYNANAAEDDNVAPDKLSPHHLPRPGDPEYNDMAFDESIVGAIDENGELYELDLEGGTSEDVFDNPDNLVSIEDLPESTKQQLS
jgi:hypothetical protein